MDKMQQLNEIFETGMIGNVYYADKKDAVYQALYYYQVNKVKDTDVFKLYKNVKTLDNCVVPRITAIWLMEKKTVFSNLVKSEIKTFDDMFILCLAMFQGSVAVVPNKWQKQVLCEWFIANLDTPNSIKYFFELKGVFEKIDMKSYPNCPEHIQSMCMSYRNDSPVYDAMFQRAQIIQERILEKGRMDTKDINEIRENGIPYTWLGKLMTDLDEDNLQLFIEACVETFDEKIVTDYMKYYFQLRNKKMIGILVERSHEIMAQDCLAFNYIKKYVLDFKYLDVVLDTTPLSREIVEKFEYKGNRITRYPHNDYYASLPNPFTELKRKGKWLLITSGHPGVEALETNVDKESEPVIWVVGNPNFVPKNLDLHYVIGASKECILQVMRLMGLTKY